MAKIDNFAMPLFGVLLSRGMHRGFLATLTKGLEYLEMNLEMSSTDFFLSKEKYSMADLYAYPFVSRLFLMKGTAFNDMYEEFDFEKKYKYLFKWFKTINACPELNDGKAIPHPNIFKFWLEELETMNPGKKPPFRLPVKL